MSSIIPTYKEILADLALKASAKRKYGIDYSWFSDTFIIFASDDSWESFLLIERASRLFFQRLILKRIPLRGALTVGDLYTQKKKNIFLGKALIDAYEYGNKQNWIGFILTPSVYDRLESRDYFKQGMYRRVQYYEIITHPKKENVFAFTMNAPCLEAIQAMENQAPTKDRDKYKNTENFIMSCGRLNPIVNR